MSVVQFPRRDPSPGWQSDEMNALLGGCGDALDNGAVSGWAFGSTENGDPQLYLLGPAPDHACLLCVSRLGRHYVLEDGEGRILFEHDAIAMLTEQVRGALSRQKAAIVGRLVIAWMAIKETFEERIEPVLAEPVEVLSHIGPQLAAIV